MKTCLFQTIGFDPLVSKEEAATFDVDYMGLEEMWPLADFITVHVPLIPPTKGNTVKDKYELILPKNAHSF